MTTVAFFIKSFSRLMTSGITFFSFFTAIYFAIFVVSKVYHKMKINVHTAVLTIATAIVTIAVWASTAIPLLYGISIIVDKY